MAKKLADTNKLIEILSEYIDLPDKIKTLTLKLDVDNPPEIIVVSYATEKKDI